MGIPLERMPVWDPYEDRGGLDRRRRSATRACSCGRATARCTTASRRRWWTRAARRCPGVKVIVHPECRFEVAQKADAIGSTEGILKTVRESPPGTKWAVGTELNMVNRLAREVAPEREVVSLDDCFCVCSTMFRIDPPHVLWALEYLVDGRLVNVVSVPEDGARREARPRPDADDHLDRLAGRVGHQRTDDGTARASICPRTDPRADSLRRWRRASGIARVLARVHGGIGLLDRHHDVGAVAVEPDAGARGQAGGRDGLRDLVAPRPALVLREPGKDDQELVAAPAHGEVGVAGAGADRVRGRADGGVAGDVALSGR